MLRLSGPPIVLLSLALSLATSCGEEAQDRTISIEVLEPVRGPIGGGNKLFITGSGLEAEDLEVSFDGTPAESLEILSDGRLEVIVPEAVGPGPVSVLIVAGSELAYAPSAYTYNDRPEITGVVPDRGSHRGAPFSLVGTGFLEFDAGDTAITVDGEECLDVSVQSDAVVVCNAPGGQPWTLADVTIENRNGSATARDGFGYMKAGLFVADGRGGVDGSLYYVDLDDNSYAPIAKLDSAFTGITSHLDGTLYGVTSNGAAVSAGFPRELHAINPFTGEQTLIGSLLTSEGQAVKVPDIAISYDTNEVYGWSKTNRQLARIALDTGRVVLVGGDTPVDGSGIAFDFSSDLFLAPDGSDGEIFEVDRATGLLGASTDLVDAESDDISALTTDDNVLFGVREGVSTDGATLATVLLEIDPVTGVVIERMDLPFGADALTITPPLPFE